MNGEPRDPVRHGTPLSATRELWLKKEDFHPYQLSTSSLFFCFKSFFIYLFLISESNLCYSCLVINHCKRKGTKDVNQLIKK